MSLEVGFEASLGFQVNFGSSGWRCVTTLNPNFRGQVYGLRSVAIVKLRV